MIRRIKKPLNCSKNGERITKLLPETGAKVNLVAGLAEIDDFEALYTDTEIVYQRAQGKAQLMPLVDHANKLVVSNKKIFC